MNPILISCGLPLSKVFELNLCTELHTVICLSLTRGDRIFGRRMGLRNLSEWFEILQGDILAPRMVSGFV